MPIPDLLPEGVLPIGQFPCALNEVPLKYCYNDHRTHIWQGFLDFLAWVQGQPAPADVLVDGSFTSDKVAPSDIDVVFDLEHADAASQVHWFTVFAHQHDFLKQTFSVDFWVYTPWMPNDLRAFFTYLRPEEAIVRGMPPGSRKGILRVEL